MATRYQASYMVESARTAGEVFLNGGWDFITRAAYLINEAHDKKTADTRKRSLEISLMKSGKHSADTITEYLRKAQIVADHWKWDDVVPVNAEGAYVDDDKNPLGFVEMLNYGEKDTPEEWADGSIVQRLRAMWQRINDIKRSGPPGERKAATPKAKAETAAKSEAVTAATSEATEGAEKPASILTMGPSELAKLILEMGALENVRLALIEADSMTAEMARAAA